MFDSCRVATPPPTAFLRELVIRLELGDYVVLVVRFEWKRRTLSPAESSSIGKMQRKKNEKNISIINIYTYLIHHF